MSTPLTRVTEFLAAASAAGAVPAGPLVVGVSGGPDSLALLHLLRRLAPAHGVQLHVAHLDHGWRGPAGAADAAFVAATCAAWDLPCTCGAWDVPAYAARADLSPEDAARRVRYTFLAGVAAAVGAGAVAVGHNADDQVETVVGHWLRGAGTRGLGGMAPWARLPLPSDGPVLAAALGVPPPTAAPWLLRPLLGVWRAEITAYCAEAGLRPREDASNADPAFRRNRLRQAVIPLLECEQPGLAHRLWESAVVFRDEDAALEADLDREWPGLAQLTAGAIQMCLPGLACLPPALQRRALRRAAQLVAGDLQGLTSTHVGAALALLGPAGRTGGRVEWPGGLQVRRERDWAFVERQAQPTHDRRWPRPAPGTIVPLPVTGTVPLPGWTLAVETRPGPAAGGAAPGDPGSWAVCFDADALAGEAESPLVLRTRRPGDRLRPFGAGGRQRKVQDVLVDGGVPRHLRASLALLATASGEVLWIPGPGGRRSDHAPVTPDTRRVLTLTFIPTDR